MTDITPEKAQVRDAHRVPAGVEGAGQFGEHQHRAPDIPELAADEPTEAERLANALGSIVWQKASAKHEAHTDFTRAQLQAFVADARTHTPDAAAAEFRWQREAGDDFLQLHGYLDEDGEEHPAGGQTEHYRFSVSDEWQAEQAGFELPDGGLGSRYHVTFRDFALPARAEAEARATASRVAVRAMGSTTELDAILTAAVTGLDDEDAEAITRRLETFDTSDSIAVRAFFHRAANQARDYLLGKAQG